MTTPLWFSSKLSSPLTKALGQSMFPPVLNKYILITDTGLDIVCGPQGELCACYHNGLPLGNAHSDVSDLDFISCWLTEEETLSSVPEVRGWGMRRRSQSPEVGITCGGS